MRIIFVTAHLPHGTDEAFLVPEIEQMRKAGHDVLLVPRSPGGPIIHGRELLAFSERESVLSPRVLFTALRVLLKNPRHVWRSAKVLGNSRACGIGLKNVAVLPKALWLADVARRWNADHIYCHWAATTATMAMLASRLSAVPWSFTAHRWDIVEDNLLAYKSQTATLARFISEDGFRMARKRGVVRGENTRVIPMGVQVPPAPVSSDKHSLSRQPPIVLCPARLTQVKGHLVLLQAWRSLKRQGLPGELWLAGDGELRRELELTTKNCEIAGTVRFLGTLPHRDLITLYDTRQISLVVVPSLALENDLHEGVPVALTEAMSYGLPVISTFTGGIPELVVPGTGVLVPPGDSNELSRAMKQMLRDEELRCGYGRGARDRIVSSYEVSSVVSRIVATMQSPESLVVGAAR